MNVQEYILSGIIESYVLGMSDAAERAEFERMCAEYPEVLAAREAFEISLEQFARLNAKEPPASMKSRVLAAIDMEQDHSGQSPSMQSAYMPGREQAKVISANSWQRYVAAAAVVLLLISTGFNFYLFNKYRSYNQLYNQVVAQQQQIANNNQVLQSKVLDYEKTLTSMSDPRMAIIKMPAVPKSPDPASQTTVYWDTVSKDVYLAVNQLPVATSQQQYQLWAIVDGKPVDAGVFDLAEGPSLLKMKRIPKAQAFAITLEKRGGSAAPTMEKMFVFGKV